MNTHGSTDRYKKLAITISPPNRVQYSKDKNANTNLFKSDEIFIDSIMKYIKCYNYIIYPEFSEKGRLHYHGVIDLDRNQYIRYMKYAQHKLPKIGHVDIKPLETFIDNLKWTIYITKEWGMTREILDISGLS